VLHEKGEGVRRLVGYRDRGLAANATLDVRTLEGFEIAGPSIKLPHAFLNALVRSGTWRRRPRPPLQVLRAGEQVRSRGTRRPVDELMRVTEAERRGYRSAGRPVLAWTVDDEAELRKAVETRLSGVISNDPRAVRRRMASWRCACDALRRNT
jgi:hypothetical protein